MPAPPAFRPAIGVDLGGTKIEAVVLDGDGRPLWNRRVATPAGDYRATLAAIAALIADAEHDPAHAGATIGIGMPGSATATGLIRNANSTCLNGRPLQRDLEALLGRPVRLENDANCLALSEATDGAAAGAPVSFSVILGTGTGAGIVVGGRLLTGPNRLAGEWGHNPLPWPDESEVAGPACFCGRRGCVETWVSGPAIACDHARRTGATLSAEHIAELAAAGHAGAVATLARHATRLAKSLANVVNLLDPDVIVLAGGVSRIAGLTDAVGRELPLYVFSGGMQEPVRTRLVTSRHGDASGVRGAARLWRAGG